MLQCVGWVCLDCRSSCNKTIEQLQSAVASTNEQMADIVEKVALCKCKCSVSPQPTPLKPDAKAAPSDMDVILRFTVPRLTRTNANAMS